jgi:hypothetical protein
VTPGVAPENKLVNRLVNEGESSDEPTLEASEQPDSSHNQRRGAAPAARLLPVISPAH